jgi:hypothetical protein
MDRWIDGWMYGWMYGCIDGWLGLGLGLGLACAIFITVHSFSIPTTQQYTQLLICYL